MSESDKNINKKGLPELLKLDYDKTVEYIHKLADIRFKLLALLPVFTGGALTLISKQQNTNLEIIIGVAVLGFMSTLGVMFYDQRNTEIYNGQIGRAKELEEKLYEDHKNFDLGTFSKRRKPGRKILNKITIWHDLGVILIYAVSLALWSYLFIISIFKEMELTHKYFSLTFLVPITIFILTFVQLIYFELKEYSELKTKNQKK